MVESSLHVDASIICTRTAIADTLLFTGRWPRPDIRCRALAAEHLIAWRPSYRGFRSSGAYDPATYSRHKEGLNALVAWRQAKDVERHRHVRSAAPGLSIVAEKLRLSPIRRNAPATVACTTPLSGVEPSHFAGRAHGLTTGERSACASATSPWYRGEQPATEEDRRFARNTVETLACVDRERIRQMLKRICACVIVVGLLTAIFAMPAAASDHLFNASHSSGIDARGFVNPVANNPSGMSGAMASPGTVPGEGDPKVGADQGTPAANLDLVNERSGGHWTPQH
jgi:hypothetical protein